LGRRIFRLGESGAVNPIAKFGGLLTNAFRFWLALTYLIQDRRLDIEDEINRSLLLR
jgi:hypothetical protein